jgi:hypothetical protein
MPSIGGAPLSFTVNFIDRRSMTHWERWSPAVKAHAVAHVENAQLLDGSPDTLIHGGFYGQL